MAWPRFRIRSMMITVALLGIILWVGLNGYRWWDYRRQMALQTKFHTVVFKVKVTTRIKGPRHNKLTIFCCRSEGRSSSIHRGMRRASA